MFRLREGIAPLFKRTLIPVLGAAMELALIFQIISMSAVILGIVFGILALIPTALAVYFIAKKILAR